MGFHLLCLFFLLTPGFSPGPINCFNSGEEFFNFWNGSLVYPQIDIKHGFSDPSDLEYFNSQAIAMDARWLKALGDFCLKHETGQSLPYVGTAAAVRDLIAIAEYFDGRDCDINYYGVSYGTTIGNYLIDSKLSIPAFQSTVSACRFSVPQSCWQDHLGWHGGPPLSRFPARPPHLGPSCRIC